MMQISYPTSVPATIEIPTGLAAWKGQSRQRRYESEEARSLLVHNGMDGLSHLFTLADHCLHHHKGRAVSPVILHHADGKAVEAFVKLNWGCRRLLPRVTDLRTGQVFQSLPEREWHGIQALRSLGLLVPKRIALFKRGWFWFQAAVIIQRVPPEYSLDEMIRNGSWDRLVQEDRRDLLKSVVRVMQRIHHAGLGWRGTCTRHFFPERTANGLWQSWLIDCEGIHGHVTERAMARDYRKLHRAFEISGANAATLREFQELTEGTGNNFRSQDDSRIRQERLLGEKSPLKPSA